MRLGRVRKSSPVGIWIRDGRPGVTETAYSSIEQSYGTRQTLQSQNELPRFLRAFAPRIPAACFRRNGKTSFLQRYL